VLVGEKQQGSKGDSRIMARKKKPVIKPSTIVKIVAHCGACDKDVEVQPTFEVDVSQGSSWHPNHGPDEYCYCEFPSANVDSKRLEFICPNCQYFSTVYIT
jgi:hypothetical protein